MGGKKALSSIWSFCKQCMPSQKRKYIFLKRGCTSSWSTDMNNDFLHKETFETAALSSKTLNHRRSKTHKINNNVNTL